MIEGGCSPANQEGGPAPLSRRRERCPEHRAVYAIAERTAADRCRPYARATCADHGRCGLRCDPRHLGKERRPASSCANRRERDRGRGSAAFDSDRVPRSPSRTRRGAFPVRSRGRPAPARSRYRDADDKTQTGHFAFVPMPCQIVPSARDAMLSCRTRLAIRASLQVPSNWFRNKLRL